MWPENNLIVQCDSLELRIALVLKPAASCSDILTFPCLLDRYHYCHRIGSGYRESHRFDVVVVEDRPIGLIDDADVR